LITVGVIHGYQSIRRRHVPHNPDFFHDLDNGWRHAEHGQRYTDDFRDTPAMVGAANTIFFVARTIVFFTYTMLCIPATMVFAAHTIFFIPETIVSMANTMVNVIGTMPNVANTMVAGLDYMVFDISIMVSVTFTMGFVVELEPLNVPVWRLLDEDLKRLKEKVAAGK
jgi:hypothetical protein